MKNVQVIDGALNCTYSIFRMSDDEFHRVFPLPGQDVEFIEDLLERLGEDEAGDLLDNVWGRCVSKADVNGIHGTLFYEMYYKKKYYPTKREDEMIIALPE